jgi:hypothetical protein
MGAGVSISLLGGDYARKTVSSVGIRKIFVFSLRETGFLGEIRDF